MISGTGNPCLTPERTADDGHARAPRNEPQRKTKQFARQPAHYLDSIRPENKARLLTLERAMTAYYKDEAYHADRIKGMNSGWTPGLQDAQIAMCGHIPAGSTVLEVGCGDGAAEMELRSRAMIGRYFGVDLNPSLWPGRRGFLAARAGELPFRSDSVGVVLSMFVLEHLVFPRAFLDESWRVLARGGTLLSIAPDFARNAMASEPSGFSYGSGRDKLAAGRWWDAFVTGFDQRVRLKWMRAARNQRVARGQAAFPVLLDPRCLYLEDFVPDCDAVYPACPEEMVNYLRAKPSFGGADVFYRSTSTFGLRVWKQ